MCRKTLIGFRSDFIGEGVTFVTGFVVFSP